MYIVKVVTNNACGTSPHETYAGAWHIFAELVREFVDEESSCGDGSVHIAIVLPDTETAIAEFRC